MLILKYNNLSYNLHKRYFYLNIKSVMCIIKILKLFVLQFLFLKETSVNIYIYTYNIYFYLQVLKTIKNNNIIICISND